ncbi:MAG: CcdB family protein [Burkholderiales bacterium]|nr:CcdB family protein [Burkholderiales bacterium]
MAQFDVYPNPHPGSRESVPYVLDVQSGLIDQLPTRLVMPLSRVGADAPRLPAALCPPVEVGGETLLLMPHLAAPMPARLLRKPVASIAHRSGDVASALDAVLSGF